MADEDVVAALHSQLHSLQSRVKELEIANVKLMSLLSNCSCHLQQIAEVKDSIADDDRRPEPVPASPVKQLSKGKGGMIDKKSRRGIDQFSMTLRPYPRRYVALKVMYFGKRFYGFASEAHTEPTIESELFRAFEKLRLLVGDKKESKYSRCGRTDKGVSAIGQVICLYLRSNFEEISDRDAISVEGEIDYVRILNNVLPHDVRIIGWCPAPVDFHARFSCLSRKYKYFFWRDNLDISAMETAGKELLGKHDFRNFCKMDAANVHNYKRCVLSFEITHVER